MARTAALVVLLSLIVPVSVSAADLGVGRSGTHAKRYLHHRHSTKFPLTRRGRDIRMADACWHDCQVDAARVFRTCLGIFPPTVCVPSNDAADRFCLRECRVSGGPWVNLAY
jgi:hypothetical protein